MLERLEDGITGGAGRGRFEDIGEEELVVAERGRGGEGFDEEPGLGGRPGVSGGGEVEDVHFQDF